MHGLSQVPVFISRYSLSPRTSIGQQTQRLLQPHQDWFHFHWRSNDLRQLDRRSLRFENLILSRVSFLHNRRSVLRLCERAGIGCWVGSELREEHARRLTRDYAGRISKAYLAPLDEEDAQRCLALVNLLGVRFVLHLWDVLEGDVRTGALRSLIDRAENVFCVSDSLVRDVSQLRSEVDLLLFSRDPAVARATAPTGEALRIVLHGNICSYADGLDDLHIAINRLEAEGRTCEVWFAGLPKILRVSHTTIRNRVKLCGFSATLDELDAKLAAGHVAFLPGPKAGPAVDMRSRYSIPSRMLDYMAVGLPILGVLHKDSAGGAFMRELGLAETATCEGPEEVAYWLRKLGEPRAWSENSRKSLSAFDRLMRQQSPAEKLKSSLDRIDRIA
jgi:hypothetical protein